MRFSEKLNFADGVYKIGAEGESDSDSAAETWHNVSAYDLAQELFGSKTACGLRSGRGDQFFI